MHEFTIFFSGKMTVTAKDEDQAVAEVYDYLRDMAKMTYQIEGVDEKLPPDDDSDMSGAE